MAPILFLSLIFRKNHTKVKHKDTAIFRLTISQKLLRLEGLNPRQQKKKSKTNFFVYLKNSRRVSIIA